MLGNPETALDLGCGIGNEVAILSSLGVTVTGLEKSSTRLDYALKQWGYLSNVKFVLGEAVDYLSSTRNTYDAIYSVWGAIWFTCPQILLPAALERLSPGGVLAFSQAPAIEGCYGAQGMYGSGFTGKSNPILRWSYTVEAWYSILNQFGFEDIDARVVEAPDPEYVGTLIVRAKAPRASYKTAGRC
ncbi:class I SAM-dependent methyltransferase [Streptomyces sp. NPDC056069]|uniref:class I SAM-dependent methyltransferase n=1 Tax=Streptomyces sp. NPDC056069 TaxID=3345702 RepID=UPI0035DF207E